MPPGLCRRRRQYGNGNGCRQGGTGNQTLESDHLNDLLAQVSMLLI
jgi:hypothetical protein